MKSPLVSVIITSYNQENFIGTAIKSALAQTYNNIEIIIVDDASIDKSPAIIQEISSGFEGKRIKLLVQTQNSGVSHTRNVALSEISGEYVCFLDGDDVYLPEKISTQVDLMESHKNVGVSYHDSEVFDSKSDKTLFYYSDRFGRGNGTVEALISKGMYGHFGSFMFRKSNIAYHKFDMQLEIVGDWVFVIDVLMEGNQKFLYIDKALTRYRRHSMNITLNWGKKIHQNLHALDVIERRYGMFKFSIHARKAELYFIMIVFSLTNMDFNNTFRSIFKYLKYSFPNPFRFLRIVKREAKFFLENNYQFDTLTQSLWKTDR